jgi:hypothetical protein
MGTRLPTYRVVARIAKLSTVLLFVWLSSGIICHLCPPLQVRTFRR